jgi:hypothetical protein
MSHQHPASSEFYCVNYSAIKHQSRREAKQKLENDSGGEEVGKPWGHHTACD